MGPTLAHSLAQARVMGSSYRSAYFATETSPKLAHNLNTTPSTNNVKYTLCAECDLQHKGGEVHALCGVDDDGHPYTPVAIGGEGIQEAGKNRIRYYPRLVNVIETEEYTVRHPTAASEHPFHLGQEHAPKKQLLPKDRVEYRQNHEQDEEPPGTLQPLQDLLESEDHVEAVALGLREKREDRHPGAFYRRFQYELHHRNRDEERCHPKP